MNQHFNVGLPLEVPCSWSKETLRLRFTIQKIWTQSESRQYGLYWSEKIQFGRLWPEPTVDELNAFYDIPTYANYLSGNAAKSENAPGLISRAVVKVAYLADKGILDPIPAIASLSPTARTVCDIGCGGGVFLSRMQKIGLTPTGLDPSPVSGDAVRKKEIEFHAGTAEDLPAALVQRKFDVVSMFQSLEHCRRPSLAVANAASLLDDDGLLVIDVPNMGCVGFDKYGPAWWHTDAGRHLQFFTQASLTALLSSAGLCPVKWEYQGLVTQFTPGWIIDMAEAWDSIGTPEVPRPSLTGSLSYLPRALLAEPAKKYEIIRVYAKFGGNVG